MRVSSLARERTQPDLEAGVLGFAGPLQGRIQMRIVRICALHGHRIVVPADKSDGRVVWALLVGVLVLLDRTIAWCWGGVWTRAIRISDRSYATSKVRSSREVPKPQMRHISPRHQLGNGDLTTTQQPGEV
jgi:hypothetical protein